VPELPEPELLPELVPELLPELVPELLPELVPELLPELVPELLPELPVPELLPELLVPELLPELLAPELLPLPPSGIGSITIPRVNRTPLPTLYDAKFSFPVQPPPYSPPLVLVPMRPEDVVGPPNVTST
jgi:hypothetical protein